MNLVTIPNIANTVQGYQVDLVLNELYITTLQNNITTPWQLVVKDGDGNIIATEVTTGIDAGEVFQAWYDSVAGQQIRGILTQQATAHLADSSSTIRKKLDFFATLNP